METGQELSQDVMFWGAPSFWINLFPLYWGRTNGFFEEKGIDLKVKLLYGGPELLEAFRKGVVRIGNMGLPPFLKAFSEGLPARIIGSAAVRKLDTFLVARPDVKEITDLKGGKVGVLSVGSCDSYFLRRILQSNGMNPELDAEVVPLRRAYGMGREIFSQGIDATLMVEPFVTLGESQGVLKVLARVADYFPEYQWGILFAHEDLIQGNRARVEGILDAYKRSSKSIKDEPERTIGYGAKLFQMKKEMFRKALERSLPNWEEGGRIDRDGLNNAIRIQEEIGALSRRIDVEELLYP
jgi:NitT/TauT family transport system substrate-binding protein